MSERQLRLGIVGLGRATMSTLPTLVSSPRVAISAVCTEDADVSRGFAESFGCASFASIDEMCRSGLVDTVYVATPHELHAEHTMIALEGGCHVLVEKPMTLSRTDALAMTELAEALGLVLVVGPSHAHDGNLILLSELAASGRFGQVRMVNAFNYTDFLYRPRQNAELDTSLGGGVLFNQLPHHVDVVRTVTGGGTVSTVDARTGIWDNDRPVEGAYTILADLDGGIFATMTYSGFAHFDSDEWFDWIGESGASKSRFSRLATRAALQESQLGDGEGALKDALGVPAKARVEGEAREVPELQPHFGLLVVSLEHADLVLRPTGVDVHADTGSFSVNKPISMELGGRLPAINELWRAVIEDEAAIHDGRWGLHTVDVCLATLASARRQQPVVVGALESADIQSILGPSQSAVIPH